MPEGQRHRETNIRYIGALVNGMDMQYTLAMAKERGISRHRPRPTSRQAVVNTFVVLERVRECEWIDRQMTERQRQTQTQTRQTDIKSSRSEKLFGSRTL